MTLSPITAAQATDFVSKWHYTGSAQPGVLRYGWEIAGELVGVSIYDTGVHAMRTGVFGHEHYRHVLHHHRLAMTDDAPGFESEFIGACLRDMRVNHPEVWAIVTYADLCRGHQGTIYQATNAVYTGLRAKGNLKFLTPDGLWTTTQSLARYGTWPERRAEATRRGWEEIRCLGKHRYVYLLGTKKQRKSRPPLQWPVLPYPKGWDLL